MTETQNQIQAIKQVDEIFYLRWPNLMVPLPRTNAKGALQFQAPLIAIPNEGKRSLIGHYMAKLMGLSKGFPDVQLMVARGKYIGLLIENKWMKNKRTKEQIAWAKWLNANGYLCLECRSVNEMVMTVIEYMERKL